jgi:hypothetical protein
MNCFAMLCKPLKSFKFYTNKNLAEQPESTTALLTIRVNSDQAASIVEYRFSSMKFPR